jgi:CcmD family protein
MENLGYLFAAYTIIFVAIFFYVWFLWRRQARLEAELRAMEEKLRDVNDEIAARSVPPTRSASS